MFSTNAEMFRQNYKPNSLNDAKLSHRSMTPAVLLVSTGSCSTEVVTCVSCFFVQVRAQFFRFKGS